MLTASEARKLSDIGFDVGLRLDLIEKTIRETATEGKYALWYCFEAKDDFFVEKIQKKLEAVGYAIDYFYDDEDEVYKFYINWRDAEIFLKILSVDAVRAI
jgi:hypothetical protein